MTEAAARRAGPTAADVAVLVLASAVCAVQVVLVLGDVVGVLVRPGDSAAVVYDEQPSATDVVTRLLLNAAPEVAMLAAVVASVVLVTRTRPRPAVRWALAAVLAVVVPLQLGLAGTWA